MTARPTPPASLTTIGGHAFRRDFVAGAMAGCVMRVALFPVDTLKTNMQRSGTGAGSTLRRLLSEPSSTAALYRGLAPALLEIGVNRGALMGISTAVKGRLPDRIPEAARDAAAGCAAGVVKTTALHPLDTLTCRGQVGRAQWDLLWPRPRPEKLYRGFGPAIVRSSGGMAIWLTARNGLTRSAPESLSRTPWQRDWLVGMTATAATDVCTFPLDTLKKNLQADGGRVVVLAQRLLRDGGVVRLYRGYTPRLAMQAANGGLWNFIYVRVQEMYSAELTH
uniref:Mitochondrial carrier protein n=1 Tax=Odontella aurita TaxID=265563 RepID=A0A6U6GG98_9STRA|mmetsp:Transcript_41499/g.125740  ORF Transcript_41499/g.125740 Transcript_41499/m.125740 type:complete len:279 (+) Transcript_41499:284-1120(+)